MPVDKQVWDRYKILDHCFRKAEGMTYNEILDELEEQGIDVSIRTLKNDKKVFEDDYGAAFVSGLRLGKEALVRYEDVESPVLFAKLSKEEKGQIGDILCKLQVHNDIPHYQWMILLLDILVNSDDGDDIGKYVEFDNNLDLEGMESFRGLMEACIEKYPISFEYAKYANEIASEKIVTSPYLLKQYNKRWFLICRNDGFKNLSTYALDRIVPDSLKRERELNYTEPDWDYINKCLATTIGLTGAFSCKEYENVKLRVAKSRYPYIRTKPIVPWQQEISEEETEDSITILLEGININNELKALILSYAPDVEVIEPLSLRKEIGELLKAAAGKYI